MNSNHFIFPQTLVDHGFKVLFRKKYPGPYFHKHMVNPFVKIVEETYLETRSKVDFYKYECEDSCNHYL